VKITKIAPCGAKSSFYKIFADGQYAVSLPAEVISRFDLKEGGEIDVYRIAELSKAALVRRARERLLYSLDRRLHSEKELRQKLVRDYPPDVIDLAVAELDRLGLINDEAFARAFAEQRLKVNKKGPYAVLQELYQKGVDRETAKIVVDEVFSEDDGEINAALMVAQKYRSEIGTPKGKQRLYSALCRKGFSYSTVKEVMRSLCSEIEFED